jgi:maltose alpha-D-glucosyltransferase/alpha-amylase
MGDNVYLGDRNGVRTPMQWSSERNAGFSRADPARLYFPVIMDPVYGYEAINVEAQERSPASLLQWMKRMIALRRQQVVFSRGSIEFIRTDNRKVLTYVRRYEGQIVLCVANLARTVQPVSVPVAQFAGLTPVELLGQTEFPRLTEEPYFLTLAPYGFYWFQLKEAVVPVTARVAAAPEEPAALPVLFAGVVWESLLDGGMRTLLERQALVPFLERQRWFGGKARHLVTARIVDWTMLRRGAHPAFLVVVETRDAEERLERYVLPLAMDASQGTEAMERSHPHAVVARISGARKGVLYDGMYDDGLCATLLASVQEGRALSMRTGELRSSNIGLTADRTPADAMTPLVRGAADQSNTSVTFGQQIVMKLFRRLEPGPNPDVEIGRVLTERSFARVPALVGTIDYLSPGEPPASIAMLQRYVWNQGNGWQVTVNDLGRYLERASATPPPRASADEVQSWLRSGRADPPAYVVEAIRAYLATADVIGRRTGELHAELAAATHPAFAAEPFTAAEIERTAATMRTHAREQLRLLERSAGSLDEKRRPMAMELLSRGDVIDRAFDGVARISDGGRVMRCHGDYHLGQILVTEGDIAILDFEGEPGRPLAERRAKRSPLRDVAGMLRSFGYASLTAVSAATLTRPEDVERLEPWARLWETWVGAIFLRAYLMASTRANALPADPQSFDGLLQAFVLDKAFFELGYELNNRPDWVHIPLNGLLRLTGELQGEPRDPDARPPLHAGGTLDSRSSIRGGQDG